MTEGLHAPDPNSSSSPTDASSHTTTFAAPASPVERLITQPDLPPAPPLFAEYTAQPEKPGVLLFLFGVVLPVISISVELLSHWCAEIFFDPLPTVWHVLLVCAVPVANGVLAYRLRREPFEYRWWFGWANGLAIAVAAFYTVLYAPLLPIAAFALILLGLGLLPMTPIMALFASIFYARMLRRRVRAQAEVVGATPQRLRGWGWGVACALLILLAAELPTTATRVGLHWAASADPATSLRGVRWLRTWGREDALLRLCYGRRSEAVDLIGFGYDQFAPVSAEQARTIYYRVTGQPFDTAPAPTARLARLSRILLTSGSDQTGELTGAALPDLSLTSSRLDGSVDADAALGYLEWTMVFHNSSAAQQETVAQLALPPGGVVSRLTLWVNGEEREAAFAERGKVQAAYDAVVSQRRDPVLVTDSGVDRVSVRCFPVPPNGEMKIRLGITAPLHLESSERAWLRLPQFVERNFTIAPQTEHAIWVEGKAPVTTATQKLHSENPRAGLYAVRGALAHADFAQNHPAVLAQRPANIAQAWTPDPRDPAAVIRASFTVQAQPAAQRIVLVVDGSRAMREFAPQLADALTKLPERAEFALLVAGDDVQELAAPQAATPAAAQEAAARLRDFGFAGGRDNLSALARAWDVAAQRPESVIVWLHGPQPMLLGSVEDLRQRWERRPGTPRLLDLQVSNGANLIAEKLDGIGAVQTVLRLGAPAEDLERLFARWRTAAPQLVTVSEKVALSQFTPPPDAKETSAHLARLWADGEVGQLLASGETKAADQATKLAASYQLVTPVTGAVVLETKEQYERAGLQPVERGTVPTIPEPEEWLLLAVVALVLLWTRRRRRLQWAV